MPFDGRAVAKEKKKTCILSVTNNAVLSKIMLGQEMFQCVALEGSNKKHLLPFKGPICKNSQSVSI